MAIIHHKQLKSLFLVITALLIASSSPEIFAEAPKENCGFDHHREPKNLIDIRQSLQ